MKDWEISNLIEALWAHGQHARAYHRMPRKYNQPFAPIETLERAALLIEELSGIKGARPIWNVNKDEEVKDSVSPPPT